MNVNEAKQFIDEQKGVFCRFHEAYVVGGQGKDHLFPYIDTCQHRGSSRNHLTILLYDHLTGFEICVECLKDKDEKDLKQIISYLVLGI